MCIQKKSNFGILIPPRCHNIYGCMKDLQNYFSLLFKTNKHLADEQTMYDLLTDKIGFASAYKLDMPLTEISKKIVDPEINKQFGNFYNKGTLVAMCLDIIIREKVMVRKVF